MIRLFYYVFRDARSGHFVTADFAKANPDTTVRERIWFWQKAPK